MTAITRPALWRRFRLRAALFGLAVLTGSLASAPAASADFSITRFDTAMSSSQAAGHPDTLNNFDFSVTPGDEPDGHARRLTVDLPPGLVGDPSATPACSQQDFANGPEGSAGPGEPCPRETQVGTVDLRLFKVGAEYHTDPVYNLEPAADEPALLGIPAAGHKTFVRIVALPGGKLRAVADDLPFDATLLLSHMTLWGVPADHNGGGYPRRPFMSAPTNCDSAPATTLRVVPYEDPDVREATFTETSPVGCEEVPFDPTISAEAANPRPGEPTGLEFEIDMPYDASPDGLVTAHLKDASVTLPQGMAINPSAADGLEACSDAQFSLGTTADPHCPAASRIGTVAIQSPIAREDLEGHVFIGEQRRGDPYRMLLVAQGIGVTIKLEGSIEADPVTGRLTTVFQDNPQLPFTKLSLVLKDGPRAPLVTPPSCGSYATRFEFSSWSGKTVSGSAPMEIDQGCGSRPFAFGFEAGSTDPLAGSFSSFAMSLSRSGASQEFKGIGLTLPPGLLANVGAAPRCGAAQADAGSCGPESRVGSVKVAAGAGSAPFWAPAAGKEPTAAYLAGPYRGAPFSLSVVVPAQAGPFDLGRVVSRVALFVDPVDAHVSAPLLESRVYDSDGSLRQVVDGGIPRILAGIPINVRTIGLLVDRPGFIQNPTGCQEKSIGAQLGSQEGAVGSASSRFQVTDCASLGFRPSLKLKVSGATKRGKYPKLRAELRARPGESNIGKVSVALPHSEFLAQEHIKTICTRVQYAANGGGGKACPAGSVYGWARAFTPLLDQPLEGPVFLRSSSNPLPDLVASLDGQIHIDLAGRIDSVNGGIRTTFEAVPDAPVAKFVLTMQGGKKGLLVNSRNLCAGKNRATVKMDGQNGKVHDFRPMVGNSCAKARKGAKK